MTIITRAAIRYMPHITGTILDVTFAIDLMPPTIMSPTIRATISPNTQLCAAKKLSCPPVMFIICCVA